MVWLWCAVSDTVPAAPPQEYGNYQEAEMHLRHTLELRPRFQPAQAALRQMEAAPSTKVQRSTVCIILVLVSSARSCAVWSTHASASTGSWYDFILSTRLHRTPISNTTKCQLCTDIKQHTNVHQFWTCSTIPDVLLPFGSCVCYARQLAVLSTSRA